MATRSSSIPCPVRAEISTEPGCASSSRRASTPSRRRRPPRASALLTTSSSGRVSAPISAQHGVDGVDLALEVGGRPVDHVDDEVGLEHHLEGGPERLDHLVGQLADEADRVGQQHRLAARQVELAGPRVEGGEEAVLDEDVGLAQAVQQRRLPGVRVPHQRDGALATALAAPPLHPAGAVELAQVGLEAAHPLQQPPAVDLELGLAGTPGADPARLLAQRMCPRPREPRQPVAQQGQLHLGPALGGAGVLGEDVEDHGRAVDGGTAEDLLQVALLRRREVVVEHDRVGVDLEAQLPAAPPPCPGRRRSPGPAACRLCTIRPATSAPAVSTSRSSSSSPASVAAVVPPGNVTPTRTMRSRNSLEIRVSVKADSVGLIGRPQLTGMAHAVAHVHQVHAPCGHGAVPLRWPQCPVRRRPARPAPTTQDRSRRPAA